MFKFNPFTRNFDIVSSSIASSTTPGGSDTQIQFNNGGAFGGSASLIWDETLKKIGLQNNGYLEGNAAVSLRIAIGQKPIVYLDSSFISLSFNNIVGASDDGGDIGIMANDGGVTTGRGGDIYVIPGDKVGGTQRGVFRIQDKATSISARFGTELLTVDRTFTFQDESGTLTTQEWVNSQITGFAFDSTVVHNTSNESIGGHKYFTSGIYDSPGSNTRSIDTSARNLVDNQGDSTLLWNEFITFRDYISGIDCIFDTSLLSSNRTLTIQNGSGTLAFLSDINKSPKAIFNYYTDATVGGTEADIYSSSIIGYTLDNNGDKIISSYSGNFVTVGTELTQLKVYFGGTAIWDSTGVAPTTGTTSWRVYVEIIKSASDSIRYSVSLNTTGASGFVYETCGELTGLTLTGSNTLKITGTSTGVGSGSGDIIGKMGMVSIQGAA